MKITNGLMFILFFVLGFVNTTLILLAFQQPTVLVVASAGALLGLTITLLITVGQEVDRDRLL